MSYVRFHWADSDMYVYEDYLGHISCCGCLLNPDGPWEYEPDTFIRHVAEHHAVGHVVKPNLERDIWEDWRDGEFDEWADPFDPEFPEPAPRDEAAAVGWNREVLRDLGLLMPVLGKPQINRDGTPYERISP